MSAASGVPKRAWVGFSAHLPGASWGWLRMVNDISQLGDSRRFNTMVSAIAAGASVATVLGGLVLYLSSGTTNTHDIQSLQSQVSGLSAQVSKLADKIDQGPRSDQMREIDRHLSALDGRMDGMDTRAQADEQRLIRAQTILESIQQSSDAKLAGHQK